MTSKAGNTEESEQEKIEIRSVSDIDAVGFNAKYFNNTHKPYKISRGKSKLFRRGMILILVGMIISIISIRTLPEELPEAWSWATPLLWLPRLAALFFIVMAFMRIREIRKVKGFLTFTNEGVQYEERMIPWKSIEVANVEYTATSDNVYDLVIKTADDEFRIDISSVDEFSADVASVFSKYLIKFREDQEMEAEDE